MKVARKLSYFFTSIRNRLLFILLLIPMLSLSVFVSTTYRNVSYIVDSQIYKSFQLSLDTTAEHLRLCVEEMHNVSSNLIFSGSPMARQIENYYYETDRIARDEARLYIESTLITYEFNTASIGLVAILDVTGGVLLASSESSVQYDKIASFNPLYTYLYNEAIHEPHKSVSAYSRDEVISLYRPFTTRVGKREYAIYIESNKSFLDNLLDPYYQSEALTFYMEKAVVASDGRILCTSNGDLLPTGAAFSGAAEANRLDQVYNILTYRDEHWSVYGLVEKGIYQWAYWQLLQHFALSLLLFVALQIVVCVSIWRSVYDPIKAFAVELKTLHPSQLYIGGTSASAAEFDEFRAQFNSMRVQIQRLVAQAEIEAKNSALLENELLLSRINPHFLHNTLDNIKWLARERGESEVADLLTALNNLMYYNLGKQKVTTLREELRAVDDYLLLQRRIRPFVYEKRVEVSEETLKMSFPCFTMQPIVENSLMHGYTDSMKISVHISETPDSVSICIGDTGKGMRRDTLEDLREKAGGQPAESMGIGLAYVFQAMKLMYAGNAAIGVDSKLDKGTEFSLRIIKSSGGA